MSKPSGAESSRRSPARSAAERAAFLGAVLKNIPDMVWIKSPEGAVLACNPVFEAFFGVRESAVLGKTDYDLFAREQADLFRANDLRTIAAGRPVRNEEVVSGADGRSVTYETVKTPVYDEAGAIIGVLGIARDISARKQLEQELRHQADMNDVLQEITEAAILAPSLPELFHSVQQLVEKILPAKAFHINFVDEAAGEVYMPFWTDDMEFIPHRRPLGKGLTEYVMGLGRTTYLRPVDLEQLEAAGKFCLAHLNAKLVRHYLATPLVDAQNHPMGTMALMLLEEAGEFSTAEVELFSIVGAQVSLAIRNRQAAEALRESERRFASAFSNAPIGMVLLSLTGRCLKVNPAFSRLVGYEAGELVGTELSKLFHPDERSDAAERLQGLQSGAMDAYQVERRYIGKAGQLIHGWVSASLVHDEAGVPLHLIVQVADVSELRRLERELRLHADKLEETVERRTQELHAANQELTAVNAELSALNEKLAVVNMALEETNQQLEEEIGVRRETEASLRLRESQYQAASTLLIASTATAEEQMREAVRDALRMVGAPVGYIGLYNPTSKAFDICCAVGPADALIQGPRPVDRGLVGEVFARGEIILVPDYRNYPLRQPDEAMRRYSSVVMVPLKLGGRMTGGLVVAWLDEPYPLSAEGLEVLRQYGNLIAIAMERNETQRQIERKNRLLEGLAETSEALMGELAPDAVLQGILARAIELTGIPHGFALLLGEADVHQVSFRAGHGRYRDKIGQTIVWRGGVFEEMLRTGRLVVVEDYAAWPLASTESASSGATMSMQAPLWVDGRIIGDIGLSVFGETVSLDPEKIAAFEQYARVASLAVKNALHLEKIRNLAFHDTLTGLPNRAQLNRRLADELERARCGQTAGAVMFVDLDDLKTVNDHFGHTSGDSVIVAAAADIVAAAGDGAFVARVGGDEFVVILPEGENREHFVHTADRLVGSIRREYEVRGQRIHMSTSLGITMYPEDGDTPEEILKNADIAMYAAKAAGKNCWRLYEQGMQQDAYARMILSGGLRHALDRGELYLDYQPLVRLRERSVVGFEALLRWRSPEHGQVPPERFISLAEQSGLILGIGEWVVGEACRFARKLADEGREQVRVAVNVSPRQLTADGFVGMVRRCIAAAGIRPGQLEVEITENVLIESLTDSTRKLAELSAIGVRLSLDDFGTGYSSLTYLRNLPVETLKIDKSFIARMLEDQTQEGFIRAIIDMAHMLGLTVVAEGVETQWQLTKLEQAGCDCVQGFLFGKPGPPAVALRFSF